MSIVLLAGFGLLSGDSGAAPEFSDWSSPVNLGPVVNSAAEDFGAHLSKDGLSLYFTSTRPGGFGGEDLWISKRARRDEPWSPPVNLGSIINTDATERSPALSRDGRHLFFTTTRAGGFGGFDIWVSWRHDTRDDFGWQTPVNLGAQFNTDGLDAGASYLDPDDAGIPLLFLTSRRPGGAGGLDIYVSELTANGSFGPPVQVNELSGPDTDVTADVRRDGLEIMFASSRSGTIGGQDLYVSTRQALGDPWSTPVNLGAGINSAVSDQFPALSSDGETLFFNSDRPGGSGGSDIYMSTRSKRAGR